MHQQIEEDDKMADNHAVLELLRESMLRKYVQSGFVVDIKPVKVKGIRQDVIEIMFNGMSVYCKSEQFSTRKIASYNGFIGTRTPFVVKDIERESGVVIVSRVEAIPLVQSRFLKLVREGDVVRGTVTGLKPEFNLVFVEVEGFPCMVGSGEWDLNPISDLREVVAIGTEVECKVTSIKKYEEGEDKGEWEFDYRIRLSRRALLSDEKGRVWDDIEKHHQRGEFVLAKIVARLAGQNSYLIEITSSGIVVLGNLQNPLSQQYRYGLPQGLQVHAQLTKLDKEKRQGKARIFRIDPTLQSAIVRNGI
jgi:hypothetical protein